MNQTIKSNSRLMAYTVAVGIDHVFGSTRGIPARTCKGRDEPHWAWPIDTATTGLNADKPVTSEQLRSIRTRLSPPEKVRDPIRIGTRYSRC